MIVSSDKISDVQWKEFLQKFPTASVYHTPEWMRFLSQTFGYKPHYIFSLDESGNIDGFLPLMKVESKLTKNRFESLPFSHICAPLGNVDDLISEAVKYFESSVCSYLQINGCVSHPAFATENKFCTHILPLNSTKEEIWKKMDRGSTRWAVNKSKKERVISEESSTVEDLEAFYELNCVTKKELGVPCHPHTFFKDMMSILKDYAHLYVARYGGDVIGGGIMLEYGGYEIYGYGAANPQNLRQYPYNAFVWKSIEDALDRGCRIYDFGRTSHENSGLIQFKQRWGTERVELSYSYYPHHADSVGSNREGLLYHSANTAIQHMPIGLYKKMSDKVFKHFG